MAADVTARATARLPDATAVAPAAAAPPPDAQRAAARRAASLLGVVTPLGWSVLGIGVGAGVAGAVLGWAELLIGSVMCIAVLLMAVGFVVAHAALRTDVELDPP